MLEDIIGLFDKKYKRSNSSKKLIKNKIKKTKLLLYDSSLLKTLFIPLPNSNTISIGIFIKAGSRQEDKTFGIAHFLEHMTFKGTTNITSEQLMLKLDMIGAQYNAMTGHEFTLYYISGNPTDIELILQIVIDLYLNPIFPETDIEKERNVVLEELRMNKDNNSRQLSHKIFNEIFKNAKDNLISLSRPVIGFKDTIEKLTRTDIIDYRNKYYKSSNCLLCISGNFNIENTIKLVEDNFNIFLQNIKANITSLNRLKLKSNLFKSNISKFNFNLLPISHIDKTINKYIHFDKDINQTIIKFVFNTFNTFNDNNVSIDLICDILSNGFSSRLFNLLRNKMGVSYYNNSSNTAFNDIGILTISVGVDHKSVFATIEAILNEIKIIKQNGITLEELNKSKKQNETNLLFQFKDPFEYLMHFGMNYLIKKPLYNIAECLELINKVSLEQINKLFNLIFNNNNIIIGTIGRVDNNMQKDIKKLIS